MIFGGGSTRWNPSYVSVNSSPRDDLLFVKTSFKYIGGTCSSRKSPMNCTDSEPQLLRFRCSGAYLYGFVVVSPAVLYLYGQYHHRTMFGSLSVVG